MNPEITNEQLIAWLYGELPESQRPAVERYLDEHPEAQAELEQMRGLRKQLQQLPEPEQQTPVLMLPAEPVIAHASGSQWWKSLVAVAASLALLMGIASLSQLEVQYDAGSWNVRFGSPGPAEAIVQPGTSAPEIRALMQQSLSEYQDSLRQAFATQEAQWEQQFASLQRQIPRSQGITKGQFEQLSTQIREENYELVVRLTEWSQTQQRIQVEDLIVELTQYLEMQRNEDLQKIGYAFQQVQQKNEASEELLAELVQYLR
jgi:hypothetical protein